MNINTLMKNLLQLLDQHLYVIHTYIINNNLHFTISCGRGHHDDNIGVIQGGTDATVPFYIRKIPRAVFYILFFFIISLLN